MAVHRGLISKHRRSHYYVSTVLTLSLEPFRPRGELTVLLSTTMNTHEQTLEDPKLGGDVLDYGV